MRTESGEPMAGHWKQALEVELWGLALGALEPIRAPLLASAELMPVGSIAAGLSRVALAFGAAAEAADVLDEDGGRGTDGNELANRLLELGAVCTSARACLAALGAEDEPLTAAGAARGLLLEMVEATRTGGLLECRVEVGPALIAHIGGFVGPLSVGGTLISDVSAKRLIGAVREADCARLFAEGERLVATALEGLGDHALDAAISCGAEPMGGE